MQKSGIGDESRVETVWSALVQQASVCLRELLADLLATRMLGLAFFMAQTEFLKTLAALSEPDLITPSGYPGIRFRLSVAFDQLIASGYSGNVREFLERHKGTDPNRSEALLSYLKMWEQRLHPSAAPAGDPGDRSSDLQVSLTEIVEEAVRKAIPALNQVASEQIPDDRAAQLRPRFFERITHLEIDLPPSARSEPKDCFAEIMSAAWAYQLLRGEERESEMAEAARRLEEYRKTCRLALKSIELIPIAQTGTPSTPGSELDPVLQEQLSKRPGVLSAPCIRARVALPVTHASHLGIFPFNPRAVQTGSLDLRLGNWFVVAKRTTLRSVDLTNELEKQQLLTVGRERIFVPHGERFVIHPGDFVLGATLEFIALPDDLMAFVEGKSGIGRLGLLVATATQIAPGFHGVVVLELANTGTVPLELAPEIEIAQLVLQGMSEPVPAADSYRGRHQCQIQP